MFDIFTQIVYNGNMDNIPIKPDDEALFGKLVLQGTLTLTAIREKMYPVLEGIDDISLIQKMIGIRAQEATDG